jgi:hypothetical protein
MNRITWTRSEGIGRSGWIGTVGKRRLFTIEMSASRRGKWVLRTTLPFNIKSDRELNEDSEQLKILAERVLNTFVTSLGASFNQLDQPKGSQ